MELAQRVAQCSGLRLYLHAQIVSYSRIRLVVNTTAMDNLAAGVIQPEVRSGGIVN
jgi:hypothetical protein